MCSDREAPSGEAGRPARLWARRVLLQVLGAAAGLWLLWDGILWWLPPTLAGAMALVPWRIQPDGSRRHGDRSARWARGLGLTVRWTVVSLVAAALLITGYSFISFRLAGSGTGPAVGPTALWLGHAWVGEGRGRADYVRLASELRANRVTDVFVHVGPLNGAGLILERRIPHARALVRALGTGRPSLRIQAWIGQVEVRGGGPLDLANQRVRENVTMTSRRLLDLGFDGIHYDIEPIYAGDRNFLDLLARTHRQTRARDAVLSVAAEDLDPLGRAGRVLRVGFKRYHAWTKSYFREVARRVDQIAVMTYDTGMPTDWLYGWLVRWETRTLAATVPGHVTLFLGVPTYEDPSWGHHPRAENLPTAITAVRKGIAGTKESRRRNVGVAIFAEWTTTPSEWADYRRLWLAEPA